MQKKANKKLPWWKRFLRAVFGNLKIAAGDDEDFGDDVKIGAKTRIRF